MGDDSHATDAPAPSMTDAPAPGVSSRPRGTGVVVKLALSLVTFVVLLGAVELVLRSKSSLDLGFRYDAEKGFFGPPEEFERDDTENAFGFHDVEPEPKAPGTKRVLLVGDSYVAAKSVPLEQTVGRRLEHHLREQSGDPWDVVCLAQPGWGQRQELVALKSRGPGLEPDVVLTLFLSFNDVRNNSPKLQSFGSAEGPGNRRPGKMYVRADEAPLFLVRGSVLNQLVSYRLARASKGDAAAEVPLDYGVYAVDEGAEWTRAWEESETLFRATRDAARDLDARYLIASASTPHGVRGAEEGVRFLQAVYPGMADREWDLDRIDRKLEAFCALQEIPLLRMEPVFRRRTAEGRELHWRYDGHWNVEGNDLAGADLARFVLASVPD